MATIAELKQMQLEWQEHCRQIQSITDTKSLVRETAVEKERRIRRLQKDYAPFASIISRISCNSVTKSLGEVVRIVHMHPFTMLLH
ncbi:Uncharacterised protein [Segatella oris]|uniref:Uncharacterized protein n=1 Tax=Segatella oris TaxID=28135 RepID=A0A448L281_9BACT|nr:Uncharacterised protein [Segatella oris]